MKHRAETMERATPRRGGGGRHAQPKNQAPTTVPDADVQDSTEVPGAIAVMDDPTPADVTDVPESRVPESSVPESSDAEDEEPGVATTDAPFVHKPAVILDEDRPHAPSIVASAKWRTRSFTRSITFLLLIGAAAVAGLTGRLFAESRTDDRMNMFVAAALVVAGLWALLTATAPQIVTLRGSLLTIKSRRGTERFDLAEGMQQVDVIGDPRSSKWAVVLHRSDCSTVQLNRRDVDALVLDPVVRHFRGVAQRRRSEHWARFGL